MFIFKNIYVHYRAFLFPSDLHMELEYWAETGEFDEDELHEVSCLPFVCFSFFVHLFTYFFQDFPIYYFPVLCSNYAVLNGFNLSHQSHHIIMNTFFFMKY